jgi:hypothetical protein
MLRAALAVALTLATLAFGLAIGVFLWPGPITEQASWRADVGATLATAMALALGAVALLITARVESSDFKAEQETKSDLARLMQALASIQTKGGLWRAQSTPADFGPELLVLQTFANSTTGFAMRSLSALRSRAAGRRAEEWRLFFIYVAECLSKPAPDELVINRAMRMQELLLTLDRDDLRFIGRSVSDLVRGIVTFRQALDEDTLIKALRQLHAEAVPNGASGDAALFVRKLQFLKGLGIADPNIDLFLAVVGNQPQGVESAIQSGADPSVTDAQLLRKYNAELLTFRDTVA